MPTLWVVLPATRVARQARLVSLGLLALTAYTPPPVLATHVELIALITTARKRPLGAVSDVVFRDSQKDTTPDLGPVTCALLPH